MNKADKLNLMVQQNINVAQFISIDRTNINKPKYVHIYNKQFNNDVDIRSIIKELILASNSKAVNIRSFSENKTKGNKFVMNKKIEDIDEIYQIIKENADNDLDSIINENIDICDGGVSGVVVGDIIEFSPNDTPRCVEKNGVCSLPRKIGLEILETVYGFKPNLNFDDDYRVEFSIHPLKQGIFQQHTIIWEYEKMEQNAQTFISFPNNFSKYMGDKVFGLLLANSLGFDVPESNVISRNIAPFVFGKSTLSNEKWIRTAPFVKQAGKFTTHKGWLDPYKLMSTEDIYHTEIGAIISQSSVESKYSGASFVKDEKSLDIIEGVKGNGDDFMVGKDKVEELPSEIVEIIKDVNDKFREFKNILGNVSFEWVYDGEKVWIVQLNQLKNSSSHPNVIVDGDVSDYIDFDVNKGLEELRNLIQNIDTKQTGIKLIGNVGITSHFGDLLRQNQITSLIVR